MAKLHVLKNDLTGRYQIIAHVAVPAGNNSASKPWENVLLAAKVTGPKAKRLIDPADPDQTDYAASVLPIGSNGWEILQAEYNTLDNGTVVEIPVRINQRDGMSQVEADFLASKAINEWLAKKSIEYKYYGWSYTP